jgi:hypothetical protein
VQPSLTPVTSTVYGDTGSPDPTFGQIVTVGNATNAIPALANVDVRGCSIFSCGTCR